MRRIFQNKKIVGIYNDYFDYLKITFLILLIIGLVLSFFFSPSDYLQGEVVRIMYVHVPSSWLALMIFSAMSVFSLISLIFRFRIFTIFTKSLAPIGFTFSLISIFTGSLWGQPTWGTFWTWDARLTSMMLLVLLYIFYILSWVVIKNIFTAEKISSLIAVFGLANIPLIKFSVIWWNTLHQPASIKFLEESTIHESMLAPLMFMFIAFAFFSLMVFLIRFKVESFKLKILREKS